MSYGNHEVLARKPLAVSSNEAKPNCLKANELLHVPNRKKTCSDPSGVKVNVADREITVEGKLGKLVWTSPT